MRRLRLLTEGEDRSLRDSRKTGEQMEKDGVTYTLVFMPMSMWIAAPTVGEAQVEAGRQMAKAFSVDWADADYEAEVTRTP